jgi:hypothetical protein
MPRRSTPFQAIERRVQGRRRVKTDAIDLEAITEMMLAGRGIPITARAAAVTETHRVAAVDGDGL